MRKAVEKGGKQNATLIGYSSDDGGIYTDSEVLLEKIREALKEICDSQFGIENETAPR